MVEAENGVGEMKGDEKKRQMEDQADGHVEGVVKKPRTCLTLF